MPSFSAVTLTESYSTIESLLQSGVELIEASTGFSRIQLAHFIDQFYLKANLTSTIERSISKSLCLFLYELHLATIENGGEHYNIINRTLQDKEVTPCSDYSVLKHWRIIERVPLMGSGYWKVNDRGIAFLNGNLQLSEKLTIKNRCVIAASENRVSINDFEVLDFIGYNPITLPNIPTTEI